MFTFLIKGFQLAESSLGAESKTSMGASFRAFILEKCFISSSNFR